MTNPHGSFIWYELLTSDPDAAQRFYADVIGWSAAPFGGEMDYRIFSADGEGVGGLMKLPEGAPMRPGWLGYIGVDDVDASVRSIEAAGGKVHMPARDLPGVGRMALVADPQGIVFYVMRGASEGESKSFSPTAAGHCSWNELGTTDQAAALAFYKDQFGWEESGSMPMGEMGDYIFLSHHGVPIGAAMKRPAGPVPPSWLFAFRVNGIQAAAERIRAGGGAVLHGPHQVPGGDHVVVAADPQGAVFDLVGTL